MQKGLAKYSAALTVMAEPMRQSILSIIGQSGKLRGKDILDKLDLTQPTLSHHMNVLLGAGLVTARKEGRCVWYSINKTTVKSIADAIISLNQETTVTVEITKAVSKKPATKPAVKPVSKPKVEKKPVVVEKPDIKDKKNKDKDKKKKKKNKDKDKDKTKKKKK